MVLERKILISGDRRKVKVVFPYNPTLVMAIKDIPGRRWVPEEMAWVVPMRPESLKQLIPFADKYGFETEGDISALIDESLWNHQQNLSNSRALATDIEMNIEGLGGTLRPFQEAGVRYLLENKRCFLADEMGTGKTPQSLALLHAANAFPALVLCPATVKLNWGKETLKWLPDREVGILDGKGIFTAYMIGPHLHLDANIYDSIGDYDVIIVNYDILKPSKGARKGRHDYMGMLKNVSLQAVIADESTYIKNNKAARSKAAREIAKNVTYRLALTGTPILNRPSELINQLNFLGRLNDLGGWSTFTKRYCAARQGRFGLDLSGAAHLEELNEKMRGAGMYIRRTKKQVLPELPPKQRTNIMVEIDNRNAYKSAANDVIGWLGARAAANLEFLDSIKSLPIEDQDKAIRQRAKSAEETAARAEQLVKIGTLRQLAAMGKISSAIKWISDFLETGEKLVVFAHHKKVQQTLLETFPDAAHIFGGDDAETRQANIERFQDDFDCQLIICSLQSAGMGITLTAASNVVFLELGWTPATHSQAEDRLHRIGAKQTDSINCWYLLAQDTIDEDMQELLDQKRQIIEAATEGDDALAAGSILQGLISSLTDKAE